MPPTKIKKLAVIGAGFMGASVGYVTAQAGIDVVLIDRDQEAADKGKAHATEADRRAGRKGRAKQAERDAMLARITPTPDYAALAGLRPRDRGRVRGPQGQGGDHAKAQQTTEADAIFASNTSTLPITSLAEESKDQGKFIGIHFFSPVEKMMLVEIILGKNTGDVALAAALDYVRVIGKTPIVVNDCAASTPTAASARYIAEGNECSSKACRRR